MISRACLGTTPRLQYSGSCDKAAKPTLYLRRYLIYHSFRRIDPIPDTLFRLRSWLRLDLPRAESVRPRMRQIELLVETYLAAERELVAAVDAAGGAVPLPDGRIACTGRAEFDALLGGRRKRAWVTIRKNAPMPSRR